LPLKLSEKNKKPDSPILQNANTLNIHQ